MRKAIAIAVLALVVPAAASAKQGPPPLASTWAPGVEISYTETVTDGLGNVVSQVHRDGIPAGTAFGNAAVAGVETPASHKTDAGRWHEFWSHVRDVRRFSVEPHTRIAAGKERVAPHEPGHWSLHK